MKKPQDPRKHGLKEPSKEILETHKIRLNDTGSTSYQYSNSAKCSLNIALETWENEKKKISNISRLSEGPFIVSEYSVQHLVYTIATPNPHYQYELAAYNAEVNAFKEKVEAYEVWIENRKKGVEEEIDKHIVRLEHKIANLKAKKVNEPIPFPDE